MKLAFRAAEARGTDDRQFIVTTWSSSYKKSHSAGIIYTDDWAPLMRPQFERVLDRAGARALIACDRDDPDYFYGWIAGDTSQGTPIIFYTYVKEPYRRAGVARALFNAFGVDPTKYFVYVCGTPDAIQLSRKIPLARFNPNEVRYPRENRRRPL
jgi:GNAT superfamily N-acetyltransferase